MAGKIEEILTEEEEMTANEMLLRSILEILEKSKDLEEAKQSVLNIIHGNK